MHRKKQRLERELNMAKEKYPLRIARIYRSSVVDGPGLRFAVYFQGCKHNCLGCHNPSTHKFDGGFEADSTQIIHDIIKTKGISGVTISGGDPFFQYEHLLNLCKLIKQKTKLNIWVYTGFSQEDIFNLFSEVISHVDALVVNPFVQELKTSTIPFIGSTNQKIIFTKNYVK